MRNISSDKLKTKVTPKVNEHYKIVRHFNVWVVSLNLVSDENPDPSNPPSLRFASCPLIMGYNYATNIHRLYIRRAIFCIVTCLAHIEPMGVVRIIAAHE